MSREPLLSAKDIEIQFTLRGKVLKAIRRCSLDLYEGETLAWETKEEALRLHPSLEDYFLDKVREKKGPVVL